MKPSDLAKSLLISLVLFSIFGAPWLSRKWSDTATVNLRVASEAAGRLQLYFDTGTGLSEADSVQVQVRGGGGWENYSLALPPVTIKGLRFDPLDRAGALTVARFELRNRLGKPLRAFNFEDMRAGPEIASIRKVEGGVRIETSAAASDPQVQLSVSKPLELGVSPFVFYAWPFAWSFGLLYLVVLLQHAPPLKRVWHRLGEWGGRHPVWAGCAAVLPIWVYFFWPPIVGELGLDSSWQQVLGYAYAHGFRYGRELLFTAGPTGFLLTYFSSADTFALKFAWEYVGKFLLVAALVASVWGLPLWRRLAVLLFVFAFASLFPDTLYVVLIVFLGIDSLLRPDRSRARVAGALAILVFLGFAKFTFFTLGAGMIFAALAAAVLRKDWGRAVLIPSLWAVLFVACWVLFGQEPLHIFRFLAGSFDLSDGYLWSMMLDVSPWTEFFGWSLLVLLGWALWRHMRTSSERAWACPLGLACALGLFIEWKHGFTRSLGHTCTFFAYAAVLAVALPSLFRSKRRLVWTDALVAICLLGFWSAEELRMPGYDRHMADRMQERVRVISAPWRYVDYWKQTYETRTRERDLPKVRAEVGQEAIDFISFEQEWLLFNKLNYRPRPVFQSYSVHTPELERRNLDFFFSKRAPRYVLVGFGSIDGRYPSQDDALVLANLPRLYEPVLEEKGLLLLRRKTGAPSLPETRTVVSNQVVQPGIEVPVPDETEHALWLQVFAEPTKFGRFRALLFQPTELRLVTTDDQGSETSYRLLPKTSGEGFLIYPNVLNQGDFKAFLEGRARKRLRSVRIECSSFERELWKPFGVAFSRLPEMPIGREP